MDGMVYRRHSVEQWPVEIQRVARPDTEDRRRNRDHKFSAITVRHSDRPIYRDVKDPFTIERKEYNRSLAEYMNNPAGTISGSDLAPLNADGSEKKLPKRKLFFNPMELD